MENDGVKIKSSRDPTSENLYISEFKMALFDNDKTEELLLLMHNFNMTLNILGTLAANAKIQYLVTLLRGETGSRKHCTLKSQLVLFFNTNPSTYCWNMIRK